MYNRNMKEKRIKFEVNQTFYYAGDKYLSGDVVELLETEVAEWEAKGFGKAAKAKPKKSK
tara:strand:+ start:511 stop:690 length:180 start_codon:yes stop_codon:yes gene_type:complete